MTTTMKRVSSSYLNCFMFDERVGLEDLTRCRESLEIWSDGNDQEVGSVKGLCLCHDRRCEGFLGADSWIGWRSLEVYLRICLL